MYGSYRKPRELHWIFGCLIYLALMGEAFFGYLLPWGQMSYWGAQVIVNLFSAVPIIGEDLGDLDSRRLHDLRHHAEPLLRVPRHRGAAGAAGARRRAPDGAARNRLQQSRRHRDQEAAEGPGDRASARRHLLPSRTTRSRTSSASSCSSRVFSIDHVLRARHGRLLPRGQQLHSGRSAEDARAHRAGVVLHAVLRDAARGALVPGQSSSGACW